MRGAALIQNESVGPDTWCGRKTDGERSLVPKWTLFCASRESSAISEHLKVQGARGDSVGEIGLKKMEAKDAQCWGVFRHRGESSV